MKSYLMTLTKKTNGSNLYEVFDPITKVKIGQRLTDRNYVACAIVPNSEGLATNWWFGRLDLIGKGDSKRAFASGTIKGVAYLDLKAVPPKPMKTVSVTVPAAAKPKPKPNMSTGGMRLAVIKDASAIKARLDLKETIKNTQKAISIIRQNATKSIFCVIGFNGEEIVAARNLFTVYNNGGLYKVGHSYVPTYIPMRKDANQVARSLKASNGRGPIKLQVMTGAEYAERVLPEMQDGIKLMVKALITPQVKATK